MSQQTVYNGRYELHRRLARGGMADVFLARDQLLDRPVAVKVLFPEFATDQTFVTRFRREAQAAANLNHPNIVGVYDWGEEQGTYFIVMEYVDGRSLADIIRAEGPLHPHRAADVAIDIAAALGFAHRNGVVHRDIKPGNVLISPSGQVKVADFGIARAIGAGADENLTQTGAVMGTATYFSPEQAQGLSLDPRSDLYSLGAVLYEMVTGRPPFNGDSPVAIAYKHVQEPPVPPRQVNVDVPADLEAIILQLLAKKPEQRYPSAEDLRADLRRYRQGQPVVAGAAAAALAPTSAVPASANATQAMASTRVVPTTPGGPGTAVLEEYPPEPEAPKRTGWFVVVLILLLLILGVLLFALAKVLGGDGGGEDVQQIAVPRVIDKPFEQAQAELVGLGLRVDKIEEPNNDKAKGIVFDQSPEDGVRVDADSIVHLKVSLGAETVPMPNVVGSSEAQARSQLQTMGFTNVTTKNEPNDDDAFDVGDVFRQEPVADTAVTKDTQITLHVSAGKELVSVPDVRGKTALDASNILGRAGFSVTQTEEASDSVDEGRVIRTDPANGTQVAQGSVVQIVVSSGRAPVTVPTVTGLSQAAATDRLQSQGFTVVVETEAVTDSRQDGIVQSQDPAANQQAPYGSKVTISVGRASGTTTTTR